MSCISSNIAHFVNSERKRNVGEFVVIIRLVGLYMIPLYSEGKGLFYCMYFSDDIAVFQKVIFEGSVASMS